MKDQDDIAHVAERIADLVHDVSMLENLVTHSLESARQSISHFARLAAIARYAVTAAAEEMDREVVIDSILQLAEQYERGALERREALWSAFQMRHFRIDAGFASMFKH